MAEINKPTTRLETSTFTRFLDLKPIEKFDGLKFPTNGEVWEATSISRITQAILKSQEILQQ